MDEATLAQMILTLSIFSIFIGFFIWGWKSGQFKGIEEAKYQIFEDNSKKKPSDFNQKNETPGNNPSGRKEVE